MTRSGSVTPSKGQVNAVAIHSWAAPPTSSLIRTASGIAATLSSVVLPMLALLFFSAAEKQYWKLRAPAAEALFDVPRCRHPDPAPRQLVGVECGDHVECVGKRRNEVGPRHRADLERRARRVQAAHGLSAPCGLWAGSSR